MAEGRGAGLVGLADKQAGWKEKTGDWYYVVEKGKSSSDSHVREFELKSRCPYISSVSLARHNYAMPDSSLFYIG